MVNYDAAKNIETHIHRCGRTGRMGEDGVEPGTAHTLVIHKVGTNRRGGGVCVAGALR